MRLRSVCVGRIQPLRARMVSTARSDLTLVPSCLTSASCAAHRLLRSRSLAARLCFATRINLWQWISRSLVVPPRLKLTAARRASDWRRYSRLNHFRISVARSARKRSSIAYAVSFAWCSPPAEFRWLPPWAGKSRSRLASLRWPIEYASTKTKTSVFVRSSYVGDHLKSGLWR